MLSASLALSALLTAKCNNEPVRYETLYFEREAVEGPVSPAMLRRYETIAVGGYAEGVIIGQLRYHRSDRDEPPAALVKQFARDDRRLRPRLCGGRLGVWEPLWPGSFHAVHTDDTPEYVTFHPGQFELDADRQHAALTLETEAGPVLVRYRVGAHAHGCALTDGDEGGRWAVGALALLVIIRRTQTSPIAQISSTSDAGPTPPPAPIPITGRVHPRT